MHTHDVISAFLDDEPFEATELVDALSDPEGRALLIDLIALRHLTRNGRNHTAALPEVTPRRSSSRRLLAAAAVFVALVGGYVIGERRSDITSSTAPSPTHVVEASASWQAVPEEKRIQ